MPPGHINDYLIFFCFNGFSVSWVNPYGLSPKKCFKSFCFCNLLWELDNLCYIKGMATTTSVRSRGGQPGNRNALRHGYYSGDFGASELKDMASVVAGDLTGEIALVRVLIRRIFHHVNTSGSLMEFDQHLSALGALSDAASRLGTLVRIQRLLGQDDDEIASALADAIKEVELTYKRRKK